ncbi:MAG: peptidoglycan editing factor PgeF [Gammaproteobacteria bacterium]|nr:peptidoglycan editing factor PgeF [Gammaproteobacteria bacterium]
MNMRLIEPNWPLQGKVTAFTTTRVGGCSASPYDEFNLALHVGDKKQDVLRNRHQLDEFLGVDYTTKWLRQTHSTITVDASVIDADVIEADASFTSCKNIACAVLTADCLPLLFSDEKGECVGATHAGWRGLVDGVIESTIGAMSQIKKPEYVWLGPAIGPDAFEVGSDVFEAYMLRNNEFERCFKVKESGKWILNIYQAAKIVLKAADIENIYGGDYCTYGDEQQFFSYRRNSVTGRMATIIARH